jgi:hypothetical protein
MHAGFVGLIERVGHQRQLLKKNALSCLKSRKQKIGIFLASQIYGSKGGYGQNIENMKVTRMPDCPAVLFWNGSNTGRDQIKFSKNKVILQITNRSLYYRE